MRLSLPRRSFPGTSCVLIVPFLIGVIYIALNASAETKAVLNTAAGRRLTRIKDGSKEAHRHHASRRDALIYLGNMTARSIPYRKAEMLLEENALAQRKVIVQCVADDCYNKLPVLASYGEYSEGSSSAAGLRWVAHMQKEQDILEIGASYGGGSTMILGKAARDANRSVTSIEAVESKFNFGTTFYSPSGEGSGLPVELILGSSIAVEELPTEGDLVGLHDFRPAKWLKNERSFAKKRGIGILASLLKTRNFGLVFVDGGAFTGPAEWAIIREAESVKWVALDDTHAKTLLTLFAAKHVQQNKWEIVYEELDAKGIRTLQEIDYNMTGGEFVHLDKAHKSSTAETETKWAREGWRRWSLSPMGLAAKEAIVEGTTIAGNPRNFAILRRRLSGEDIDASPSGSLSPL